MLRDYEFRWPAWNPSLTTWGAGVVYGGIICGVLAAFVMSSYFAFTLALVFILAGFAMIWQDARSGP